MAPTRPTRLPVPSMARTLILAVVGLLLAAALAWNAAEAHYDSCVQAARALPDTALQGGFAIPPPRSAAPAPDAHAVEVRHRIEGCSRLP
jgi:hypothetical protein